MKTKLLIRLVSAVVGFASVFAVPCSAEVVYSNDFSSRTSVAPVPHPEWFTKTYAAPSSPLFLTYNSVDHAYDPTLPYSDTTRTQDGWTRIFGNNTSYLVNFWARAEPNSANPFGCFSNQSNLYGKQHEVMALHPLHNAFSNGTMRFSADLRRPAMTTNLFNSGYLRVKPLFAQQTDPCWTSYAPYALSFGMDGGGNSAPGQLQAVGSDGKWDNPTTTGRAMVAPENVQATHWYRFVADLDLDAATYTCKVYDLGEDHPTLETAGSKYGETASGKLYRAVTPDNPISGLGLHCKYMSACSATSKSDTTLNYPNCPAVDNLRVYWRATGDTTAYGEANLVYENDFATRRFRCVQGTTSSTATADALVVPSSDTFTFWNVCATTNLIQGRNLVPSSSSIGCDGWKKTAGNCNANVTATGESGGNVLAFFTGGGYSKVVHAIGQTITSGKVKCECDFRLPTRWNGSSRSFTLCLGDDSLATAENAGYAVRVGMSGENADFNPYTYVDLAKGNRTDSGTSLKPSTWYRIRVVADLGTRKYDYSLYELGAKSGGFDRTLPAEPVYTRNGNDFYGSGGAPGATQFTTFAIYAYASGDGSNWADVQLADNIRIWKGTDGVDWNELYRNDFSTRVRHGARTTPEAKLLNAEINRAGLDGWMRRGKYMGDWRVRDIDGDKCLALEEEARTVHAVHTLGKPVTRGRMTFRVDLRPPSRCTGQTAQIARFYIGGDEYAQGEIGTYNSDFRTFVNAAVGYFGFSRKDGASPNEFGYYSQYEIVAYDAAGTHTGATISGDARGNWYRFVATLDVDAHTWRVDVYNQGTSHPAPDAANGTLVQSFADLAFKVVDPSGVTAFGLSGGASGGTQPLEADTKSLLVDNIVVEKRPSGLLLLIQ